MILSYRIHLEISKKLKRQTNETTNEKSWKSTHKPSTLPHTMIQLSHTNDIRLENATSRRKKRVSRETIM